MNQASMANDDDISISSPSSDFNIAYSSISLEVIKNAVSNCIHDSDTTHLANLIRMTYSNADLLNQSFLFEKENRLDLSAVRQSYEIILGLEPKEKWERLLVNALELLLATINLNIKRYQSGDPNSLRIILILLEVCSFTFMCDEFE
jgi:hypothetical protein